MMLERVLASLPTDVQQCWLLHQEGFSPAEIVEQLGLGLKPETVRKRIASVRHLLLAALESEFQQTTADLVAEAKQRPHA